MVPIPPKLLLLFIAIPVIEVFLFIKLGGAIGLWATLGIIVVTAIIGASLTRSQGARSMERLQRAALSGQPPHTEIFDGVLILIAGILLITPGFFTDALGFLLLAPPTRSWVLTRITSAIGKKMAAQFQAGGFPQPPQPKPPEQPSPKSERRRPKGKVIDAEIVDD